MPVLSAGFMRAMQSWQDIADAVIDPASQHNLEAVVDEALGLGINHFETARGYGSSERQLGLVLSRLDRGRYILQTKVAPTDDPAIFVDHCLDSLVRLQVDRVDLLALHGINSYRELWQACRPDGCLEAARILQRQGRVGWVGFSSHGPTEVMVEAIRSKQAGGFDYVNLHWYLIFQQHELALHEAQKRDMGVFIISPSDKGGRLYQPPAQLRALSAPLTPMQLNDLFCLGRPEIHTISIGAARPSDFGEHVEGLRHLADQGLIDTLAGHWRDAMRAVTGHPRPDAHWLNFPSWENVPGYINIRFILWLDNLVQAWGVFDFARERYALLGKETRWVPGNNAAEADRFDFTDLARTAGMSSATLLHRLRSAHRRLSRD